MSEVVFILGAGASAHTGAPIMKDFYNKVCDLYDDEVTSKEDKEAFKLIIQAKEDLERILVKVDLDLNNLETIFSLIEMGKLIDIFPGHISIDKLHEAIQRVIVRTIELSTSYYYKPNSADAYYLLASEIKFLEEQRKPSRSSVLTFNYDVAMDLALERLVEGINYCLHEKQGSSAGGFKLLKLHGSFNWAKHKKNGQGGVIPISPKRFFNEYYPPPPQEKTFITTRDLPIQKQTVKTTFQIDIGSRINKLKPDFYSGCEVSLIDNSPLIVPPTWSKTEYHTILRNVWAQAAKEISEAKYIIIIGYSFPKSDLFFKYLFALGMLNIHRIKSFWVIDINEDTINGYKEFIGSPIKKEIFRESRQQFDRFVVEQIHQFFQWNKLIK
jgi:hypothetical protein